MQISTARPYAQPSSSIPSIFAVILLSLTLIACSSGGDSDPVDDADDDMGTTTDGDSASDGTGDEAPNTLELTGTAATGAAIDGFVFVTDSTATMINVPINADGTYTADITGMTAPFILSAVPNDSSATQYSYATGAGIANLTPFTTLTLFVANNQADLGTLANNWSSQSGAITPANLIMGRDIVNCTYDTEFVDQGLVSDGYDNIMTPFVIGDQYDLILDAAAVDFSDGLNNDVDLTCGDDEPIDPPVDPPTGDLGFVTLGGSGAGEYPAEVSPTYTPTEFELFSIGFGAPDSYIWRFFIGTTEYKLTANTLVGVSLLETVQVTPSTVEIQGYQTLAATNGLTINATTVVFENVTMVGSLLDNPVQGSEVIINGTLNIPETN